MKSWMVLAALFHPALSQADIVSLGFGPALDGANLQPHVLSLQYEKDWGSSFALVGNAMGFFEAPFLGAIAVVPSVKVITPDGTFVRLGVGLGLVTHTDDRLSSIPEFNIEAALGVTNGIVEPQLRFDHWSNGSVLGKGPNRGWDTLQVAIGVRL